MRNGMGQTGQLSFGGRVRVSGHFFYPFAAVVKAWLSEGAGKTIMA